MPPQTSLVSLRSNPLDAEDFRRLGVRANEYRIGVIRTAAVRSSSSLAARQLRAPTEQTELQLSRVVTSAYRLMDPRFRATAEQRAHVGRILPLALNHSGTTRFSADQSKSATAITTPPATSAPTSPAENQNEARPEPQVPALEQLFQPASEGAMLSPSDDQELWRLSLSDTDLLAVSPITRQIRRVSARARYQMSQLWMVLLASGLLMGSFLSWLSYRQTREVTPPISTASRVNVSEDLPPIESSEGESSETQDTASKVTASTPLAPSEKSLSWTPSPSIDEETLFPVPLDARSEISISDLAAWAASSETPSLSPSALAKRDSPNPGRAKSSLAEPALADLAMATSTPAPPKLADDLNATPPTENSPYLADPFAELDRTNSVPEETAPALATGERLRVPELPSPIDQPGNLPALPSLKRDPSPNEIARGLFRVPTLAEQEFATAQLEAAVPLLRSALRRDRWDQVADDIEFFGLGFETGSAVDFVTRSRLVRIAWLRGDMEDAKEIAKEQLAAYEISMLDCLVNSFVAARTEIDLPDDHSQYIAKGLRLMDHAIMLEAFDEAERVSQSVSESLRFASEDSASRQLEECIKAITQAGRLASSVHRTIEEQGSINNVSTQSGEASMIGRYYCLMLRQWDVGLRFLARASDSRIAGVARQELELLTNPSRQSSQDSGDAKIALAGRWIKTADRMSGRSADSIRLHSLQLLHDVAGESDGLTQLNAVRAADKLMDTFPPHLVRLAEQRARRHADSL